MKTEKWYAIEVQSPPAGGDWGRYPEPPVYYELEGGWDTVTDARIWISSDRKRRKKWGDELVKYQILVRNRKGTWSPLKPKAST